MSNVRFRYKKFHIDHSWKDRFSEQALDYLSSNKTWMFHKLQASMLDGSTGMDWIIILDNMDMTEISLSATNKIYNIRSTIVAEDHSWYLGYDRMLFRDNLMSGAVQNLQSDNDVLKEISLAIINGSQAVLDNDILFPFTKECYTDKPITPEEISRGVKYVRS